MWTTRILGAAAALVLVMAAGLVGGEGLLARAGGEAYGHAWVQWWHSEALPGWPSGTDWALGADPWPVVDPLPTAFASVLGRLGGVVFGYNLWILTSVFLAFLGGAMLARAHNGDPLVGGLVLALAPPFLGSLVSGLTEDGAVGLAAVALAWAGKDRDGWRWGLCLGLLVWCGLVLAWSTWLVALALGLFAWWKKEVSGASILVGGGVGLLVGGPALWLQGTRLSGQGHRAGEVVQASEPLWRFNPWHGTDILSLVAPGGSLDPEAIVRVHPGYLGLGVLALAGFAGRSRWWWVLGLAVGVALGPNLRFAGEPLGVSNPVAWLAHLIPYGDLLNHHGRVLLVGVVALAALAARGAARIPRVARFAPLLVLLDLGLCSPLSLPLPVANVDVPTTLLRLSELPAGPMLVVPMAGPGVHPQRALLDQRRHRRRLLLSPNQAGLPRSLSDSDTARWLASLTFPDPAELPEEPRLPDEVAVLWVEEPWVETVEAVLGPPELRGAEGAAWARSAPLSTP